MAPEAHPNPTPVPVRLSTPASPPADADEATCDRPTDQGEAVRELLRNRSFMLLWSGQLLSLIGDNCLLIAAVTLISSLSDSPLAVLIPALSLAVPQVVFAMVGGVMADRWNRKVVMVVSDLLRGFIVLSALLATSAERLWILSLAAAGLAVVGVFFYPARNAAIPNVVPPSLLLAANGLIQGSYIIALIVGPAIAGAAVEIWMPGAIIFDSVTFFVSATVIGLMRYTRTTPEETPAPCAETATGGVWQDMMAGLGFIARNRALAHVLSITAVATLGIGMIVLLAIPHLREQLGAGGLEYGLAMSMLGFGSVLGGLVVSRISRRLSTNTTVGGTLVVAGGAIAAFALAPNYGVVLISLAAIGMCIVAARGALDTIIQSLAPDEMRGRVLAAVNLIVAASTAVAEGVAALLGVWIGVQNVFVAAGIVTGLTGVAAVFVLRGAAKLIYREMTPVEA